VQCMQAQPDGAGVCDAPDRTLYDNLRCAWEAVNGDFHCAMTSPFGGENSRRSARRDFYLLSAKPALPDWYAQSPPDLGALAIQLRNQTGAVSSVMVPGLGPVTLLARYKDLLPGSEAFIFASPGAGAKVNAHLSLVIVSAQGRAAVERVPTWVLSGEKTDESPRPRGYTPLPVNDVYRTAPLEDRAGFHAFRTVLTSNSNAAADQPSSGPTHVVYWIGVEAVHGKVVSSAVRVASDGLSAATCAQEVHDGTAISIEPQQGMAAATVHVRPPDLPGEAAAQPDEESEAPSGCVWIGALYWKAGAGFQVRKVDEDCEAGMPQVTITEDGRIAVKAAGAAKE
jgi:hypothetical protein